MKLIDTKAHAAIDYGLGIFLLFVPYMLSLGQPSVQVNLFYISGSVLIVYSALTQYELGLLNLLPVGLHLVLDVITGLVLMASPWVFGFADQVFIPHLVLGFMLIVLAFFTDRKRSDNSLIG